MANRDNMNKNDKKKKPTSIVEEIESQLDELLNRKRDDIEKELEERIEKERDEAQKKIEGIEKEVEEEKAAISSYKTIVAEIEERRGEIKTQLKEHLDKAIQFQTEIEALTSQTLEELKRVNTLSQELDELNHKAEEKITSFKQELEEKFGIVADLPESNGREEMGYDLQQELVKLRKIKELLEMAEEAPSEEAEAAEEPEEGEKKEEEEGTLEAVQEETEEETPKEEPQEVTEEAELQEEEPKPEEENENSQEVTEEAAEKEVEENEVQEEIVEEKAVAWEARDEDVLAGEGEETGGSKRENAFKKAFEILETHRKTEPTEDNGEVYYFENEGKIILDSECIASAMTNHVDEVKKLYIKLSQTESPKDQFFVKQEIIRNQEAFRRVVMQSTKMLEKRSCSLPEYTSNIINVDILSAILERLGFDNWSNRDDFTKFSEYADKLKNDFSTRITPPAGYLNSIIEELGLG